MNQPTVYSTKRREKMCLKCFSYQMGCAQITNSLGNLITQFCYLNWTKCSSVHVISSEKCLNKGKLFLKVNTEIGFRPWIFDFPPKFYDVSVLGGRLNFYIVQKWNMQYAKAKTSKSSYAKDCSSAAIGWNRPIWI